MQKVHFRLICVSQKRLRLRSILMVMRNRKCILFPFNLPWHYKICTVKCLYSHKGDLAKHLGKTTSQECKNVRYGVELSSSLQNSVSRSVSWSLTCSPTKSINQSINPSASQSVKQSNHQSIKKGNLPHLSCPKQTLLQRERKTKYKLMNNFTSTGEYYRNKKLISSTFSFLHCSGGRTSFRFLGRCHTVGLFNYTFWIYRWIS